MAVHQEFWEGRTVLVTGHTGFKGSWLSIWLEKMGAKVVGYALDPYTKEDNYVLSKLGERITDLRGDVRDVKKLGEVFLQYQPEIVFHLAAQPLVRLSYEMPAETYEINVMGTLNVLECIRVSSSVHAAVMVTSDKCYKNEERLTGYVETDPFGGYDPYSSSKACDEILIESWRNSFFNPKEYDKHKKAIASVRAGNVIGGGDWARDRLIPDCIRAIEQGVPIQIRNRYATRPWQHVIEPLSGYLDVAEKLYEDPSRYSSGFNFGPNEDSVWNVWDVSARVVKTFGKGSLADATDAAAPHEAGRLSLDIDKVARELNWRPKLNVSEAIDWTVEWYVKRNNVSAYTLCLEQINKYQNK
jgi:CDP-glucose 4,6-dehydratase